MRYGSDRPGFPGGRRWAQPKQSPIETSGLCFYDPNAVQAARCDALTGSIGGQPYVMRIILLGNAGSGKSMMARRLIGKKAIRRLSLDEIAWEQGAKRKPLEESLRMLRRFLSENKQWIIEGCYGDLVEAALPHCTELRFLNPGIETCIAHCHRRPWEPSKFPSPEAQQAMLGNLIEWVGEYEVRDDEYGLKRHRLIYDRFPGKKREYTSIASYAEG